MVQFIFKAHFETRNGFLHKGKNTKRNYMFTLHDYITYFEHMKIRLNTTSKS